MTAGESQFQLNFRLDEVTDIANADWIPHESKHRRRRWDQAVDIGLVSSNFTAQCLPADLAVQGVLLLI